MWDENSLRSKSKATVNLKTGRFDNIESAVIISSVCKAVQNCVVYTFALYRLYCLSCTSDNDS